MAKWLEQHPDATPDGWESRAVPPAAPAQQQAVPPPTNNPNWMQWPPNLGAMAAETNLVIVGVLGLIAWLCGAAGAFGLDFAGESGDIDMGGILFMMVFSTFWNCFVAFWTFLATASGHCGHDPHDTHCGHDPQAHRSSFHCFRYRFGLSVEGWQAVYLHCSSKKCSGEACLYECCKCPGHLPPGLRLHCQVYKGLWDAYSGLRRRWQHIRDVPIASDMP